MMGNPVSMHAARSLEELLFHWPAVIRGAQTPFEKGFALSVARMSKRRDWQPSSKQLPIMRRMVAGLFGAGALVDRANVQIIED